MCESVSARKWTSVRVRLVAGAGFAITNPPSIQRGEMDSVCLSGVYQTRKLAYEPGVSSLARSHRNFPLSKTSVSILHSSVDKYLIAIPPHWVVCILMHANAHSLAPFYWNSVWLRGGKKKRRTEKQETVFKQCTNRIIQSDDLQIAEKIFITLQGNIFSDFP